jgi:hypothetical protein
VRIGAGLIDAGRRLNGPKIELVIEDDGSASEGTWRERSDHDDGRPPSRLSLIVELSSSRRVSRVALVINSCR